ncbi:R3H domain-containing nucleic acid-binding protein [Alkalilimnicola ehrlichii]|uniref:R3H domain-containing nucleic acid-binding protein n=1 Tax=Alkalilimnicola ehrlichii TaxID=351052 RepID=UPI002161DB8A|nr:R3H domain-containing nucleic acid-binding protein [Alkalilimnicola ehrlichii]
MSAQERVDDLDLLLATLPTSLRHAFPNLPREELLEIVLDLGRIPQARYVSHTVNLAAEPVALADLDAVIAQVGDFGADNRAGIEGTLHRISAIRNRKGRVIGLTLRVGRAVYGTIDAVRDLVEGGKSLLLLGRPGVGKTTRLREIARVLADELNKRVIIIDTSNEIGGDGDVPHPAIGSARRMQVPHPVEQHAVLIEAVENHMPEAIVVDEIGTSAEALAARTIAERGVQLIGTAHGTVLENLVLNPTLSDLVGGVQTVTLTDEEARLRGTQKTVSERKAPPTFDAVVEIVGREEVVVHPDTATAVDKLLRTGVSSGARRLSGQAEQVLSMDAEPEPALVKRPAVRKPAIIFPYALSRDSVERVLRDLQLDARTVGKPDRATIVLALRSRADDPRLRRILETTGAELYTVKKNSTAQIRRILQRIFNVVAGVEQAEIDAAVREVEAAVEQVLSRHEPARLSPRSSAVRSVQHRVVSRHHLLAESQGSEPERHLVIYPG